MYEDDGNHPVIPKHVILYVISYIVVEKLLLISQKAIYIYITRKVPQKVYESSINDYIDMPELYEWDVAIEYTWYKDMRDASMMHNICGVI